MRLRTIIIFIFFVLNFSSCTQSYQIKDFNIKPTDLIIRFKRDKVGILDTTNFRKLHYNSNEYSKLFSWLQTNNCGWNKDINSWASPEIFITDGKDFRLLIYKEGLVIGYKGNNGKVVQLRKRSSISNVGFLIKK